MVWYNPLTWFKNTPKQVETPTTPIQSWTWWTAPFTWGNLTWGNLTWINLTWGNLTWNNLPITWGNLTWLNLTWSNLTWGNLTWTTLTWSNAWVSSWSSFTWNIVDPATIFNSKLKELTSTNTNTVPFKSTTPTAVLTSSKWSTNALNPFEDNRSWLSKLFDQNTSAIWPTNPTNWALSARWQSEKNREQSKSLDWFSLDDYWITENYTWWNLDLSVESKEKTSAWAENFGTKEEFGKNFFLALWNKAIDNMMNDKEMSMSDMYDVSKNTFERQFPNTIWRYNVEKAVEDKYWWEWFVDKEWTTEKNKDPFKYRYIWPSKIEFTNLINWDLNDIIDAYNSWLLSNTDYDALTDIAYDTFKWWFEVEWLWWTTRKMILDWSISKDAFMRYVINEQNKTAYRRAENERRWLPNEEDTSSRKISEWVQLWLSIIWPKVELSNFWTVEYRQEFMNDAYANLYDFVGRLYTHMYPILSVKSQLQYELWVDNLWDMPYEEVPDRWKPLYRKIQLAENNYNKFIVNHAEYISYLPSFVNPDSWRLDRMPDYVTDWNKSWTYSTKLFDWVNIDDDDNFIWFNRTLMWDNAMSPIDVMQMESMNVERMWTKETEWILSNLWEWYQYRWAQTLWAWYQELWQIMQWRTLWTAWNIVSQDSWDIPYEFIDMDSTLMATMVTNDTNRWRLIQSYWTKYFEYVPELVWSIRQIRNADKVWETLWVGAQARVLQLFNKSKYFRNTVKWRQIAQWIAYTMRAWQRLWTDQLVIDAPMSISDTEWWSDFSRDLSIYWTLFGEWIWILYDLRALWNSVWRNFKKSSNYDAIHDPIRLMVDDPKILDWVAEHLWRVSVDESWKIVWDSYKLLIQDLSSYSKYLNDMSNKITDAVTNILRSWWDINVTNEAVKKWAYNVLKQVFKQNSAMSKIISDMVTDQRANLADIIKYIWNLDWSVKIWPFISTIKVDKWWKLVNKTALKYNPWMDLVIDWWLVAWINRWLTRWEIEELIKQWYIPKDALWDKWLIVNPEEYFVPFKTPYIEKIDKNTSKIKDETRYYLTEKWLEKLWVDSSNISNPLAIALMSDDAKELIEKLKKLPEDKRVLSDEMLDAIWETNAIEKLAENLADIKYLDICK